jgi:hypothetical protein
MMKAKLTAAAISIALLAGSTFAKADGLHDVFNFLPHVERHADDRDDHHARYLGWHREYRGFARHDGYNDGRHRFEARGDHDWDDHPGPVGRWHERGGR